MAKKIKERLERHLLDNAPVILAFFDLDFRVKWANQAYRRAAGLLAEKIEGQPCLLRCNEDVPCYNCPVKVAIDTGEPAEAELNFDNQKAGIQESRVWYSKAVPIRDADNVVIGCIVAVFDLSEHAFLHHRQKRISAALLRLLEFTAGHSTRELLREFLDEAEALTGSRIGFFHFVEDDQKTISLQMWSTKTMKRCRAPGAGTHYPIQKAGVWVDCVRRGGPVIHNDYERLSNRKGLPEGHVPVIRELVVPVIRGGKLVAILGVGNKPTDYDEFDLRVVGQLADLLWETVVRKRTEEENERLQAQYYQAQKTELVGRLAGGVAHDFNNMLSVILGHVDLALEKIDKDQPLFDDLAEVRSAAERSANLTRQLLAFSRQQAIKPKPLNLNDIIHDMLKMLHRLIGENITLRWKPAEKLGMVNMDPAQIDQILVNLCINARDAISGIGRITIETRNAVFDDDYCAIHSEFRSGEYVMLAVNDTGCGMGKETLAHVFEPFFTTKVVGKGTGLGLATVYGIVKQNKGFINVYSEPGKGTVFKIYLSRHRLGDGPRQVRRFTPELERGRETVLIVEDEKMILNLCRKMLTSSGYRVLAASTPLEALTLVEEYDENVDLLISDVVMPEMNGLELATRISSIFPAIRTLFMSGYTANVIAHHGILQDDIDFLQKPFSKLELITKVQEVLTQKTKQVVLEDAPG